MAADVWKKEEMERNSGAYWTALAPNLEDYSGSVARMISTGLGQVIRGILWCGDVTVGGLKWGDKFFRKRMGPCSESNISPEALKRMKRFCEPLMDSYNGQMDSEGEKNLRLLAVSLGREENEAAYKIRWKVSRYQRSAHILRKLFSVFIKEIVEGMIGYVHLPTIMLKLLSDNGNQEFSDFKLTILGMLGTYDFERRILDTAKSLIEDDTFFTMSLLKKGASHGVNFKKKRHHKEILQQDAPFVYHRKRLALSSKSKSALAEDGLVSKYLSRNQTAQGTIGLHQHESDIFEGSYASHPISRFEILTNLQKEHRFNHVQNPPQLRLAPPAVYHEKVKKGIDLFSGESSGGKVQKGIDPSRGESSSGFTKIRKTSKIKQLREWKVKGSSIQLPLKSHIFGNEKISKQ